MIFYDFTMMAFKGFTKDLTATFGKGVVQYKMGAAYECEHSQTTITGYHCAEYPLDCFKWYPPGAGNRYCIVDAAGSIDETDDDSKIACTKITLVKEIDEYVMAYYAIQYMVKHPQRKWQTRWSYSDRAYAGREKDVSIARGAQPVAKGASGSILGWVKEPSPGVITAAKLHIVDGNGIKPDIEYLLDDTGRLVEV